MKRSATRILTTHTGSLPRPDRLVELVYAREAGNPVDDAEYRQLVRTAVREVVDRQVNAGIDVVSDGEMSKVAFNAYAKDRLDGFSGVSQRKRPADQLDHPDFMQRMGAAPSLAMKWPACTGPVSYSGTEAAVRDVDNFRASLSQAAAEEGFLTAASPGAIAVVLGEGYYPSYAAYVHAIGAAMKEEYRAITDAGFVLQLDAPDLAMERNVKFTDRSLDEFRKIVALHVEVINEATAELPRDQIRLHVCWGNYAGPHHRDVPLEDVIDILLEANVGALSIEASNPRHEHEWHVFETVKLPGGMILIPGVIDTCTNYVEHPALVAERIVRLAKLVGRENVIAGTDCGFGTFAGGGAVAPSIAWRKLASLSEGAALATQTLWGER